MNNLSKHIKVWGDDEDYSASLKRFGGIKSGVDVELKECPACKGRKQLIKNTHTPYYWIECFCGLELHASHGFKWCDLDLDSHFTNKDKAMEAHVEALGHIINKWNTRGV